MTGRTQYSQATTAKELISEEQSLCINDHFVIQSDSKNDIIQPAELQQNCFQPGPEIAFLSSQQAQATVDAMLQNLFLCQRFLSLYRSTKHLHYLNFHRNCFRVRKLRHKGLNIQIFKGIQSLTNLIPRNKTAVSSYMCLNSSYKLTSKVSYRPDLMLAFKDCTQP